MTYDHIFGIVYHSQIIFKHNNNDNNNEYFQPNISTKSLISDEITVVVLKSSLGPSFIYFDKDPKVHI